MSNKDGMAKNVEVIIKQWQDYVREMKTTVIPGILYSTWDHKLHKAHAIIEEFIDKQPRILSYLALVAIVYHAVRLFV